MIGDCDHGNFIVCYEYTRKNECPVCEMERSHEDEMSELRQKIEDIESSKEL